MSKRRPMAVEPKQSYRSERAALIQAIRIAGSLRELADKLGISKQAVHQWTRERIPADHIVEIERATGVPRQSLRPDLYEGMCERGR